MEIHEGLSPAQPEELEPPTFLSVVDGGARPTPHERGRTVADGRDRVASVVVVVVTVVVRQSRARGWLTVSLPV
jgi:hypothetical protein